MNLWIVGKLIGVCDKRTAVWEFGGVFSTEDLAIQACLDETYFIGPAALDQQYPDTSEPWPDSYYPKERKEEAKQ